MQTSTESAQSAFLENLKKSLPKNLSFADELAELLNISRDSAYRRIRGETVLSLDEVKVLTDHFKISVDAFLSPASDQVSFQLKSQEITTFSIEKWMTSIVDHLEVMNGFAGEKELIYNSKDLPIFHFFQFPRLAAFKIYFWAKTFSHDEKFSSGKYQSHMVSKALISLGEKIWDKYSMIPSTEIISFEMLATTLRQIEYAHESGIFGDKQEAGRLCDECTQLANHLHQEARLGFKRTHTEVSNRGKFKLYLNEVLIGDNTILFKMGDNRAAFITPNNFNLLMTTHKQFCQLTEGHMNNLIDKSVLISATADKARSKFFNLVEDKIQETKAKVI